MNTLMPPRLLRPRSLSRMTAGLAFALALLAVPTVASAQSTNDGQGAESAGRKSDAVRGEVRVGKPQRAARGTKDTVAAMMARQARMGDRQISKDDTDERYPDRSGLPQAPGALEAASFPIRLTAPDLSSTSVLRSVTKEDLDGGVAGGPPARLGPTDFTNSTGFRGTGGFESVYEPPDTNADVSPTTVLFHINGRIRSYGRDGSVGALNVNPDAFFASVKPSGQNVFDPRVRYDRTTGRFILVAIDGGDSAGNNNRVYVAVSDSGTISASTTFTFFTFNQGVSGAPGAFADYPTLGVDRNALYIGTNDFVGNSYRGSSAYVVRKSSILGGGPLVVTGFAGVNASSAAGPGLITPQGVDNDDPLATEGYFIGTSTSAFGELGLLRVQNPAATPSLAPNARVTVLTTTTSQNVPQKGSTQKLASVGDRLMLAKICYDASTGARTLWTSHNFSVNASGVAAQGNARVGSRWYQITGFSSGSTPSLVQAGTVFEPSDTTGYFIPSVVQSLQGHALLGSSISSSAMYGSATTSYRLASDPTGTMRQDLRAKDGTSVYPSNRWGDYSMATVDPADGMTFWSFQEYAAGNTWNVWAQKILAPSPTATPSGASLRRGATKTITVTGTGLFDPPASYPKHIGAFSDSASIVSVTYLSPTMAQVRLSGNSAAPTGIRPLTITNPDGQSTLSSFEILPILLTGTVNLASYSARPFPFVDVEIVDANGTVVETSRFRPANDGTISFESSAPAGVYTVRLRSAHFLRRVLRNVDLSNGEATISTSLVNGDVNNDNVVSIADANALRAALGSTPSSANWNPNADLNGDGVVSVADANILRASLGQQGD